MKNVKLILMDPDELASCIPHIEEKWHDPVAEGIQHVSRHPKTRDVPRF